jgi:hypothetical protein
VKRRLLHIASGLTLFAGSVAHAQLQSGDLLVSGINDVGCCSVSSKIFIYSSTGTLKGEFTSLTAPHSFSGSGYEDVLVDQAGNVWSARGDSVVKFSGSVVAASSAGPPAAHYLTPAAIGGVMSTGGIGRSVYVITPGAATERFIDIGQTGGLDLSADQCTLSFAQFKTVARYDVCHNTALGTFATLPANVGTVTAIRILPDGSLLVAHIAGVTHVSASGIPIQTYGFPTDSLALDRDGASFWSAQGTSIFKIAIDTGAVLLGPINTGYTVLGIGVVGEPRAAVSPAAIAAIPALSPTMSLLLLAGVIAIAAARLPV